MNLLLDTHVLLWWLADDPCLGEDARAAIADPENGIWVSAASAWEIAIKKGLDLLSLAAPAARGLPMALAENDFSPLRSPSTMPWRWLICPACTAIRSTGC